MLPCPCQRKNQQLFPPSQINANKPRRFPSPCESKFCCEPSPPTLNSKAQLEPFTSLGRLHAAYPKGKDLDGNAVRETPIPSFAYPSLDLLVDKMLVPVLAHSKRYAMEEAAQKSQAYLSISFVADVVAKADLHYKSETTMGHVKGRVVSHSFGSDSGRSRQHNFR